MACARGKGSCGIGHDWQRPGRRGSAGGQTHCPWHRRSAWQWRCSLQKETVAVAVAAAAVLVLVALALALKEAVGAAEVKLEVLSEAAALLRAVGVALRKAEPLALAGAGAAAAEEDALREQVVSPAKCLQHARRQRQRWPR